MATEDQGVGVVLARVARRGFEPGTLELLELRYHPRRDRLTGAGHELARLVGVKLRPPLPAAPAVAREQRERGEPGERERGEGQRRAARVATLPAERAAAGAACPVKRRISAAHRAHWITGSRSPPRNTLSSRAISMHADLHGGADATAPACTALLGYLGGSRIPAIGSTAALSGDRDARAAAGCARAPPREALRPHR